MADLRQQLQFTLGDSYTLERELGGGGMSRVFVALETRLNRRVVVKVLSPDLGHRISLERFEREIELAASLQQANIVPVLTAGDTGGLPFYIMPYVDGESVRDRLGRGPLPITEVVSVLRDVSHALAYAHARDVVHRDIKPANILLSAGTAVVTDFGIAKALSAARTRGSGAAITQSGTSIGTPGYMAPEQAAGDPSIDHRADIYALGCVAYELLSGNAPFHGRTAQRAMAAHLTETPRPIGEIRSDTPAPLAQLVMRCLEKDPDARPQSAAELARALDASTNWHLDALPAFLRGGSSEFRRAMLWYSAAFVVVAMLANAAIVRIGLPDWVFPGALVVMALGLPVLLLTAYSHRVARSVALTAPSIMPSGTVSMTRPQGRMTNLVVKASPHLSWHRARTGGIVAVGVFVAFVAGFMLLRSLGIGPAGSLLASGALERRAQVLVADFTMRNADTSLATVLSSAARIGLGESRVISVVDPTQIATQLDLMGLPTDAILDQSLANEIATRIGAAAIVLGVATGSGNGFIVSIRLVTTDGERELASFQETGDGHKGLIDAVGKLTKHLRGRIGESLRDIQGTPPLSRARTASLEALRAYTRADWLNDVDGDFPAAVAAAEEAVRYDSMFASGWRKLAVARDNAGAGRSLVDDAMQRAFEFRGRLPERRRLFLEASYYGTGPGRDRDRAVKLYQQMLAKADSGALHNLAVALCERREFAAAESYFRAAMQRDSTFGFPQRSIFRPLVWQGKWQAVDSQIELVRRRLPGRATDRVLAAVAYSRGNLVAADSAARALQASIDPATQWFGDLLGSHVATQTGRIADWRRMSAEALFKRTRLGFDLRSPADSAVAALLDVWPRGRREEGVARIEAGLAAMPFAGIPEVERPYFTVAAAFAIAGRPDRARGILAQYRAEVYDTVRLRDELPDLHTVMGEIALAEGKTADALREFRLGDMAPDGPAHACAACLPLMLARTFDAAGQTDSAIAMYELSLATPTFYEWTPAWLPLSITAPRSHYRLGALYEAKGDRAKALAHYQTFVDMYRDADPELQPMVREVRRRMATLETR